MSRPQPIEIHLGDQSYRIRPLTCVQLQRIEPLITDPSGEPKKLDLTTSLAVLGVALSRDHADVALDDVEAVPKQIYAGVTSVLRLMSPGDAAGEATAAAGADASNGATSTLG